MRLVLAAAAALLAGATLQTAAAKDTVKFAYLIDPSHEAVVWAMKHGKVTSDKVDVEATPLQIPALLQATAARTYDVIETAAMSIPRARQHGLDLRIIGTALRYHAAGQGAGIWVRQDSPIHTVADLKGKKLAVYSLGSSGITLVRIALSEAHGLNVATRGGDLDFVEMPASGMPAALAGGRVDAATLIHAQAFKAMQTKEFRVVDETAQDNTKKFGVRMVSAVLAGYGDKLDAHPDRYIAFEKLLRRSMEYALHHQDEVFSAVGKETGVDPAFFRTWFTKFSEFPVSISDHDEKAIGILWDEAVKLKILKKYPPVKSVVWTKALREETVAK
jgi:NitT/TauT family transport system substrate-binding protein